MSVHTRLVSEPLQTERQSDGRRRLLRNLVVTVGDTRITVPADFLTDFSSIPWFGRMLVRWSRVDIAGVVHDWLYEKGSTSRSRADEIWRLVAIAGEHRANALQGWTGWLGLRIGGWVAWYHYRDRPHTVTAISVAGIGLSLLAVGLLSATFLRHIVQVLPMAVALVALRRRVWWSIEAAMPLCWIWVLLMSAVWTTVIGVAEVAPGVYTSPELALTLVIAAFAVVGVMERKHDSAVTSLLSRSLVWLGSVAAQVLALVVSFAEPFVRD